MNVAVVVEVMDNIVGHVEISLVAEEVEADLQHLLRVEEMEVLDEVVDEVEILPLEEENLSSEDFNLILYTICKCTT
jgi:hypothetical protein